MHKNRYKVKMVRQLRSNLLHTAEKMIETFLTIVTVVTLETLQTIAIVF